MDYRRMTREFLLGESKVPSVASYIQSISEVLNLISPHTQKDRRRVEVAQANLREVRRHVRKLQERVTVLEEQIVVLEESKD